MTGKTDSMPMIVGHRGARNLWPENSLGGFRNLLALGVESVESVEFDVHETRDRQFVVIHDPTLERTTYSHGAIRDLDAKTVLGARLRPVPGREPGNDDESDGDADANIETVPSLEAVLALLRTTSLELHIEIKTNAVGEVAPDSIARLIDTIHRHGIEKQSILTCFVPEVLDQVRALWPNAPVLASLDHRAAEMLGGLERALERYAAMRTCIVAVHKDLLGIAWQRCLGVLGRERLGVWVLNAPAELERWLPMPVRQITTDRPDLALAARHRLRSSPKMPG
jgi:glycerophosphoryl diester phosphodiesterase